MFAYRISGYSTPGLVLFSDAVPQGPYVIINKLVKMITKPVFIYLQVIKERHDILAKDYIYNYSKQNSLILPGKHPVGPELAKSWSEGQELTAIALGSLPNFSIAA